MMAQILQTKNYKMFSKANVNRPVNEKHVAKLVKAIQHKNLMHLNPIIIDANGRIIDGQHRLEAAKILKIEVHYIIDEAINENDIADLNSNKSNWRPIDYINFYCSKGNNEYLKLREFMQQHDGIEISTALAICSSSQYNVNQDCKNGKYTCDNVDAAEALIKLAHDFTFDQRFKRAFLSAIQQCMDSGEYDHSTMLAQLNRQPGKLMIRANREQYVELLEKIYNYHKVADVANFRLTKLQRLHLERKRMKELQKLSKKSERSSTEGKFAKEFLEEKKPVQPAPIPGNKVAVKIDSKTTIYAPPGTDPDQYREQYLRNLHRSQSNLKGIKSLNLK